MRMSSLERRRLARMASHIGVSGLRVVYLSGYAAEELDHLDVGTDRAGFLAKPFKARELLENVRQALDAKR